MRGVERNATRDVREPCPHCGFPVHPDQPALRVHMGAVWDGEGMTDLRPAFHRACAAAHLIQLGRTKTEATRTKQPQPVRTAA